MMGKEEGFGLKGWWGLWRGLKRYGIGLEEEKEERAVDLSVSIAAKVGLGE